MQPANIACSATGNSNSTNNAGFTFSSESGTYPNMFLLNSTSLAKNNAIEQLEIDFKILNIDIGIITETWFTDKHSDEDVSINDYNIFRLDRVKRKGGGVCFYVRKNIICNIIIFPSVQNVKFELFWIRCVFKNIVYSIACCYHPPKPQYTPPSLIDKLIQDIEHVIGCDDASVILVAGDFNQLNTAALEDEIGLSQLVECNTHGEHLLDKVFCNRPDIFKASVQKSLIKTKHLAVLIQTESTPVQNNSCLKRKKVSVYDLRPHCIARLRSAFANYNWNFLLCITDIQVLYSAFLSTIQSLISSNIPVKTVKLGPKDPDYVTPLIKSLLVKRYKLRKQGKNVEADTLAEKINKLIADFRSTRLAKLQDASPKELWSCVKAKNKGNDSETYRNILTNSDYVNKFFASVSFDANCVPIDSAHIMSMRSEYFNNQSVQPNSYLNLESFEVESLLRNISPTSAGLDNIPHWLFTNCSYEMSDVVTHLINCSLNNGTVPLQWLTAVVTPIPKIPKPMVLGDFRPISVTPILSRLVEKLIVQKYLRPAISNELINDQFAFRPTGSTTNALVYFMHQVTFLLENNSYVRCLLVDFSKAFDCVDHFILIEKLCKLNVPSCILNWIISFLTSRCQVTNLNGTYSSLQPINMGVVQGSGLGPTLYSIMESDLTTLSIGNCLFKYADDTNLLVPENTDVEIHIEFEHIKEWANINKMMLNMNKTKEIVFHRPSPRNFIYPNPMEGIERVVDAKLLGIIFSQTFSFENHVNFILGQCSQRVYLLKLLRDQGLTLEKLVIICKALIVSRITYALPAWGGFVSNEIRGKIDSFFKRIKRYQLIDEVISFDSILNSTDLVLFKSMQVPTHCIFSLLPIIKTQTRHLRTRGHQFNLPICTYNLHKTSFVPRCLFKFI